LVIKKFGSQHNGGYEQAVNIERSDDERRIGLNQAVYIYQRQHETLA
jgi:hypothetical protein